MHPVGLDPLAVRPDNNNLDITLGQQQGAENTFAFMEKLVENLNLNIIGEDADYQGAIEENSRKNDDAPDEEGHHKTNEEDEDFIMNPGAPMDENQ